MLVLIYAVSGTVVLDLIVLFLTKRNGMFRTVAALAALGGYTAALLALFPRDFSAFGVCIAAIFIYRGFNMARILKGRMHELYLRRVTFKTGAVMVVMQIVLIAGQYALTSLRAPWHGLLTVALTAELLFAAVFLGTTWGHARRMRQAASLELTPNAELPSITVAIPARNETNDLYDCIQSLLSSQYPKLEILVLDDCSQTRRTPEIIRGFAHDGVRFINGEEPNDSWLPKNQAYERLSRFANGELIIFAGVDIRIDPGSLRRLVSYAMSRNKDMVCVMPRNRLLPKQVPIIQPMRYVWELALPRKLVNKPPVLSSCWLIRKEALQRIGGFKSAGRMVVPEAHFARELSVSNRYSFVASGTTFGISSVKGLPEQRDTAIRVAYPSTHRRPEMVAALAFAYVLWIALPLIAISSAVLRHTIDPSLYLVVLVIILHTALYATIFRLAYGRTPFLPVLLLPFATLIYVGLLHYSMYKYEFSEVTWKGRNVCLPVMRVVPHLPEV